MELDDDKPLLRSSVCNGGHDLGYLLDVLTKSRDTDAIWKPFYHFLSRDPAKIVVSRAQS